jgi:peptidoglycan/LPS O-acetylase OafA/YrhL
MSAQHTLHGDNCRLSYQPALDGMRALAVSAVLAFHAGFSWARGGFLGVDAFFVLSGYLITSLLLNEWRATGHISLTAFWARRARRLLPALFLMMLGVAGYAVVFAAPQELDRLRTESVTTLACVANWRLVFGQHYLTPLSHTWSLAIEQQWYAVWPLIVFAFLRLRQGSPRVLLGTALVLVAVSAFLMAWLHKAGTEPSRAYYSTDARAQSLLIGSVLAILLAQHGPIRGAVRGLALQLVALACGGAVVWAWFTTSLNDDLLYRGGFFLLALAVAVVIAAVAQPKAQPLGFLLALPPLRGLGLISYGVYLWHWPVYFVLTTGRTGLDLYPLFAARVCLTLALAVMSYNLIETPFRHGALRRWKASWTVAPAGAMSLAGLVFLVTRGGL